MRRDTLLGSILSRDCWCRGFTFFLKKEKMKSWMIHYLLSLSLNKFARISIFPKNNDAMRQWTTNGNGRSYIIFHPLKLLSIVINWSDSSVTYFWGCNIRRAPILFFYFEWHQVIVYPITMPSWLVLPHSTSDLRIPMKNAGGYIFQQDHREKHFSNVQTWAILHDFIHLIVPYQPFT